MHYHFVSHETFDQMVAEDEFYEWAEVFGHRYGLGVTIKHQQPAVGSQLTQHPQSVTTTPEGGIDIESVRLQCQCLQGLAIQHRLMRF